MAASLNVLLPTGLHARVTLTSGYPSRRLVTERRVAFQPNGNPSMDNLAAIFDALRRKLKVGMAARVVRAAKLPTVVKPVRPSSTT